MKVQINSPPTFQNAVSCRFSREITLNMFRAAALNGPLKTTGAVQIDYLYSGKCVNVSSRAMHYRKYKKTLDRER